MLPSHHNSPVVSVIMPVFNGERTIRQAIDSVLKQTFQNFELLIWDDGSNDSTASIINSYSDPRVILCGKSKNFGVGQARDSAIKVARGKWLAFIDADDAWMPERLEVLMEKANQIGESFIFDNILECHDDALGKIHPWRPMREKHAFGGDNLNIINVPIEKLISSNRSLLKPVFPLHYIREHEIVHSNHSYGEDMDFFLRMLAYSKLPIWYVPYPLYLYRITPGSACANKDRYELFKMILEQGIELFPESPNIQDAFRRKITMVNRDEKYIKFIWSIKDKQFSDALNMLLRNPWFVIEFLLRAGNTLAYHAHRIRHGGHMRGTY
ncbi:MAG: glycosyltransferase family 2 protein [Desulfobulbaceae bacterium]